jgi:hypothetical protein
VGRRVVAYELRSAFREPGCPVCRVRQQAMYRYLFRLLWENVNNMTTRIELGDSIGFCSEHTWQLHRVADDIGEETGISIVYEDLARDVARRLSTWGAHLPHRRSGLRWLADVGTRIRAALGIRDRPPIAAGRDCPACVRGDQSEERNIAWLVQGCAESEFRSRYVASDGLCLSHLRQALALAERSDPDVARFLAHIAEQRLEALADNLYERIRKHAWAYRHEPVTEAERTSVRRASAFFGGQDRYNTQADGSARPIPHLTTRRLKQTGLRIDE